MNDKIHCQRMMPHDQIMYMLSIQHPVISKYVLSIQHPVIGKYVLSIQHPVIGKYML